MSFKKAQTLKRKIKPPACVIQNKISKVQVDQPSLSSIEEIIIRKSLNDGNDEVINIKQSNFDYTYCK